MKKVGVLGVLVGLLVLWAACDCLFPPPPVDPCKDVVCEDGWWCEGGECVTDCIKEGGTVPVIANPPACCEGLDLIPPKSPDIAGIEGYCTVNCGDGICDPKIETAYNCPVDCACEGIACNDDDACTVDECVEGECIFTEIVCTNGLVCENGECVPIRLDPCEDIICDNGYVCVQGECLPLDPCLNVVCTNGLTCVNGECREVIMDPCEDVLCTDGLTCSNGICVDLCIDMVCNDDDPCTIDECVEGECIFAEIICDSGLGCNTNGVCVDICELLEFTCNPGFVCYHGECLPDLCIDGPDCLPGFTCNSVTGECDPDDECAASGFTCVLPEICFEGECVDLCEDIDCGTNGLTCDVHTGDCI